MANFDHITVFDKYIFLFLKTIYGIRKTTFNLKKMFFHISLALLVLIIKFIELKRATLIIYNIPKLT